MLQSRPERFISRIMAVIRKPIEILPEAALQFVADMQAYHATSNPLRRDEIAANARHILLQHMPKGASLRLTEVIELFKQLRSIP